MGESSFGTLLQRGDGAAPTEAFTTIGEVLNIGGPSLAQEVVDVTSHSSPGAFRQKVGGLLDAGEISFDINFGPTEPTHREAATSPTLIIPVFPFRHAVQQGGREG